MRLCASPTQPSAVSTIAATHLFRRLQDYTSKEDYMQYVPDGDICRSLCLPEDDATKGACGV
jgi:hypothetical protein